MPATNPPARAFAAMAYDFAHGQVVLFVGNADNNALYSFLNDTWVWDGTNWMQKFPLHSPSARDRHAMAYDSVRGEVVLFGGYQAAAPYVFDAGTWVWNGVDWTQRITTIASAPRYGHAMAYDSTRNQTVLFGGCGSVTPNDDTWLWNGLNWTQVQPPLSPGGRCFHPMAFDKSRNYALLFGGQSTACLNAQCDDTWTWNGTT
jgi:hypothetical protein